MAIIADCPHCGAPLRPGRFDATFRPRAGADRLVFGLPGAYCPADEFLALGTDELRLMGLTDMRLVAAVESDARLLSSWGEQE